MAEPEETRLEVRKDGVFVNREPVRPAGSPGRHFSMSRDDAIFWIAVTVFGTGLYLVTDYRIYGLILIACGIVGIAWSIRAHMPRTSMKAGALAIAMLTTLALVGYDIYDRRISLVPSSPVPDALVLTAGLASGAPWGSTYYEGSQLGVAWKVANLEFQPHGPGEVQIISFQVPARNSGQSEITLRDAYLVSGVNAARLPLMVSFAGGGAIINGQMYIPINQINAIPVNAYFYFALNFNGSAGLSESDFLANWASFSVVVEFDGASPVRREFTRENILAQIEQAHPERLPHITRRVP